MKTVIQRSKISSVKVNGKIVGKINFGLVILVGFTTDDNEEDLNYMVRKIYNLRIFDDENGVMNKSIMDAKGEILLISQFTLYADPYNGNRPSYIKAMNTDEAHVLYDKFTEMLSKDVHVETGRFKTDMFVEVQNDGPITIIIDSKKR
jgi:D-tyrosyl-tRNA(Tyr) deacylase